MKNYLYIFICLLLSCNSDTISEQLIGAWTIDEIYLNNVSIKNELLSNGFYLKEDKTCELPISNITDLHSTKEIGNWSFLEEKKNYYIIFNTDNKIFDGKFSVVKIWKQEVKNVYYLKMNIVTSKLDIKCSKTFPDNKPNFP